MKRNVCYVLNSAGGGATLSAIDLMAKLREYGWRFYVVSGPGGMTEEKASLANVVEDFVELPLAWWNKKIRLPWWKRVAHWGWSMLRSQGRLGTMRQFGRLFRKWKIDLVHSNTSLVPDAALAAHWMNLPHIWHLRELIGKNGLFKFWYPDPLLAWMFDRFSSRVIANSEATARFMERSGFQPDILFNAIKVENFVEAKGRGEEFRRLWLGSSESLLVGMVANIHSAFKGHEVFLRAAAQVSTDFPEVRFIIIGSDPIQEGGYRSAVSYAESLRQVVAELDLEERVTWAGFQADIPGFMNALDVVIHPSAQESFGRVAVEAMAASKPVIAAGSGGLAEIVDPDVTGFLVPENRAEGYAQYLQKLLDSKELRDRMGRAGHLRVQKYFSLPVLVEGLDALYRDVLAKQSGSTGNRD